MAKREEAEKKEKVGRMKKRRKKEVDRRKGKEWKGKMISVTDITAAL